MFTQAHLRPQKRMCLSFLWKSDLYKARTLPRKASFVKQGVCPLFRNCRFYFLSGWGWGTLQCLILEPKISCT